MTRAAAIVATGLRVYNALDQRGQSRIGRCRTLARPAAPRLGIGRAVRGCEFVLALAVVVALCQIASLAARNPTTSVSPIGSLRSNPTHARSTASGGGRMCRG